MALALVVQTTRAMEAAVVGANCAGSGEEGKGEQKLHSGRSFESLMGLW